MGEQSYKSLQILFRAKERRQTKQHIRHHSCDFGYLRLQFARDFRARREGITGAEEQNMVCLIVVFEIEEQVREMNITSSSFILNVSSHKATGVFHVYIADGQKERTRTCIASSKI